MKKITIRYLSAIFVSLLIFSVHVREAASLNQNNFLWKVQSGKRTAYILGSIHFMKKEVYPLNRKIEGAFEKSNVLVVEANVTDPGKVDLIKLMQSAFYSGDDTLERHVSRSTYELVKKEFGNIGFPAELINKQKPWFLALTLESLELVKLGFDPSYGIDMHFLSKASGKKILELESVDYQLNLFSSFSDYEQEMLLLHTLKEIKTADEVVDSLVRAWQSGDIKGMESLVSTGINKDPRMSSIYEKLFYGRNKNMSSRIQEFLKTDDTYFVVVGAGHLVGKDGIIEMLKNKGYIVEQM